MHIRQNRTGSKSSAVDIEAGVVKLRLLPPIAEFMARVEVGRIDGFGKTEDLEAACVAGGRFAVWAVYLVGRMMEMWWPRSWLPWPPKVNTESRGKLSIHTRNH